LKSNIRLLVLFKVCLILGLSHTSAQNKSNYSFGGISNKDFSLPAPKFDSGANAVIIADIGSTSFEANNKGFFTLIFTRFVRVKIINKNGYDIGNYKILLYQNDEGEEKLTSVRGSAFNLENGTINETKLDEKSIFNEVYSKNISYRKFSIPALKEGSIYDLEYTIKSPFESELRPWSFQGEYPRLWSEYTVTIAPPFHYVVSIKGDDHFDVDTAKLIFGNFNVREGGGVSESRSISISGNSTYRRWVKKNISSLHPEPFTTTLDNYNTNVSFQLNYFQWSPDSERNDYMITWTTRSKSMMKDPSFGLQITQDNNWIYSELKSILGDARTNDEKVTILYNYVRDNFKTTSNYGLYIHNSLKDVFKNKEGNVAEINLLLTLMLRKSGINADPMILSTRNNGIADESYPVISDYNYVVCFANPGNNRSVFLDASQRFSAYNRLPASCYNGYAHIINVERPFPVYLSADSLLDKKTTSVLILNDDSGKMFGNFKSVIGNSDSYEMRNEINNSSEKACEKKMQTNVGADLVINNFGIDSLKKYDYPLTVHYDFDLRDFSTAGILYFSPIISDAYKTNPFKALERHYPVEMLGHIDETYVLNMDIPTGYQVEELPKSARVLYGDNEGLFEYLIQKGDNNLQLIVRLKLSKAFFPTEEYAALREFFSNVVKKESEQIVFKKVK